MTTRPAPTCLRSGGSTRIGSSRCTRSGSSRPIRAKEVELVWHYLAFTGPCARAARPKRSTICGERRCADRLDRIRERVSRAAGPLCRWCDYANLCPEAPAEARSAAQVRGEIAPLRPPPQDAGYECSSLCSGTDALSPMRAAMARCSVAAWGCRAGASRSWSANGASPTSSRSPPASAQAAAAEAAVRTSRRSSPRFAACRCRIDPARQPPARRVRGAAAVEGALFGSIVSRLPPGTQIELVSVAGLRVDLHIARGDAPELRALVADRLRKLVCGELEVVFG